MQAESATVAANAAHSLIALSNIAKKLLNTVKTYQIASGLPAPDIAKYEAETLSQIDAALAPLTQLKDMMTPLQTVSATPAAVREMAHAIDNMDHSQSTLTPLTFEQQIEEAKTE